MSYRKDESSGDSERLMPISMDIAKVTVNGLHAVAVIHKHIDRISGFKYGESIFKGLGIMYLSEPVFTIPVDEGWAKRDNFDQPCGEGTCIPPCSGRRFQLAGSLIKRIRQQVSYPLR
jgi:hypothetical protein